MTLHEGRHIYDFSRENFVPTNRETSRLPGMKVPNNTPNHMQI